MQVRTSQSCVVLKLPVGILTDYNSLGEYRTSAV